MLNNSQTYKRTRKDHVLNNEPMKLKKEYCENCFVQFSIMSLKFSHNCKRCFRTVCENCGQQREKVIKKIMRTNKLQVVLRNLNKFIEYVICVKRKEVHQVSSSKKQRYKDD